MPMERAVTGSEFILPANPLSELTDAGLHGLIECVIYEDSGVPREPELDELGAPGSAERAKSEPKFERANSEPALVEPGSAARAESEPKFERAESVAPALTPRAASAPPVPSAHPFEDAAAAPIASPLPEPPARPASRISSYVVTAALAAGLAFFAGYLVFADRGSAPAAAEQAFGADPAASLAPLPDASSGSPTEVAATWPAESDDVEELIEEDQEEDEFDDELFDEDGEDEVAGEDVAAEGTSDDGDGADCVATIDSTPRGARVRIAGEDRGATPLTDLAVECGVELAVVVARSGYRDHRERVKATPEAPVRLRARLQRPLSQLRVVTRPPGATITINGNVVGRSPVEAQVRQATQVHVTATLRGHRVWSRQIQPRRDNITLRAELERIVP
jgi:hypothetical protein